MPRLYQDLAAWWPLFSPPVHYVEEAEDILPTLLRAPDARPSTLLELGSGGGNNASHYKRSVRATLVDMSAPMLRLSQRLNPECEHIQGDMRSIRLGRTFDAVLVQDAVLYLATEDDLRSAMTTAFVQCRSGGVALFATPPS